MTRLDHARTVLVGDAVTMRRADGTAHRIDRVSRVERRVDFVYLWDAAGCKTGLPGSAVVSITRGGP